MQAYAFMRKFLDKGFSLEIIDRDGGTEIRATKDGHTAAGLLRETSQPLSEWCPETLLERRVDQLLDYWPRTRHNKLSSRLDEAPEEVTHG